MINKIDKEIFNKITILYVEDNELALEEISYFLKRYVKSLIIAKNGEEGLEMFKKHNPDIVITDIQMPKMNGLIMSKEILKIKPNIPIVITTAYSDANYLIEAIELGIDKYLLKPINLQEVLAIIHKSLGIALEQKRYYEEYIQFIIDSNSTFTFIINANKIEFVNKNLLKMFGYNSLKAFNENLDKCKDLFEFVNFKTDINCLDYVLKNPNNEYLIRLKKSKNRQFYVKYKYFQLMNKGIFMLVELDEAKIQMLNNIVNSLSDDEEKNKKLKQFYDEVIKIMSFAD